MKREEKITRLLASEHYTNDDLILLMELLRGDGGCPWDREQTHKSIRNNLLEETYEVIEAIDTGDADLLREELGDLLLQVIFHAQIASETGEFSFGDVTDGICRKLIRRHPHIFGEVSVGSAEQVLSNWEAIKNEEKSRLSVTARLRAVPRMLPALMRGFKVGARASCFDFSDAAAVMDKVYEEAGEVREALEGGDAGKIDEEIGDLLLTISSLARHAGVDPEAAMMRATDKFIDRFERVERAVSDAGGEITKLSAAELDAIWDKNK